MQVRSCWDDIVGALEAAQDFIYVCGWSMHPDTRLQRDRGGAGVTVGELLKQKAADKVNVCLLVRARTPHQLAHRENCSNLDSEN